MVDKHRFNVPDRTIQTEFFLILKIGPGPFDEIGYRRHGGELQCRGVVLRRLEKFAAASFQPVVICHEVVRCGGQNLLFGRAVDDGQDHKKESHDYLSHNRLSFSTFRKPCISWEERTRWH